MKDFAGARGPAPGFSAVVAGDELDEIGVGRVWADVFKGAEEASGRKLDGGRHSGAGKVGGIVGAGNGDGVLPITGGGVPGFHGEPLVPGKSATVWRVFVVVDAVQFSVAGEEKEAGPEAALGIGFGAGIVSGSGDGGVGLPGFAVVVADGDADGVLADLVGGIAEEVVAVAVENGAGGKLEEMAVADGGASGLAGDDGERFPGAAVVEALGADDAVFVFLEEIAGAENCAGGEEEGGSGTAGVGGDFGPFDVECGRGNGS